MKDATVPRPISFQLDIMPVLTSAGCNTGSCHGSARGQDGFMLSLFGYDPEGDHQRITRQLSGRRINLALPEESLLVTKSTGQVPHTGGKLFGKDTPYAKAMIDWIKAGVPYDKDDIALPIGIDIEPKQYVLKGERVKVPLTVRARYSDGTDRDVTTLSSFSSSNDNSVEINESTGVAKTKNRGEAFLLARFHTYTEGTQTIVIPKDLVYERPKLPENNYIDTHVHAKLHKLRIIPSDLCSDEVFIRRVHLDIAGVLPTEEVRKAFLESPDSKKREALVDQLLERKEFTEVWVMKWAGKPKGAMSAHRQSIGVRTPPASLHRQQRQPGQLQVRPPLVRVAPRPGRQQSALQHHHLRAPFRPRRHLQESCHQLLQARERREEDDRKCRPGLHGDPHSMRPVP